MATLIIEGTFKNSINNLVRLDVYRPNPGTYDFSKTFKQSFREELNDVVTGKEYTIDFTGYTTGTFNLKISGDIANSITDSFTNTDFEPGYTVQIV